MQTAMHAAKLAILQMACQSLIADQQDDPLQPEVDGIAVQFADGDLDITYTHQGRMVAGEGA